MVDFIAETESKIIKKKINHLIYLIEDLRNILESWYYLVLFQRTWEKIVRTYKSLTGSNSYFYLWYFIMAF